MKKHQVLKKLNVAVGDQVTGTYFGVAYTGQVVAVDTNHEGVEVKLDGYITVFDQIRQEVFISTSSESTNIQRVEV